VVSRRGVAALDGTNARHWLVLGASPILVSGGAMLILAAAFLAIAVGLRRQTPARLPPAVQLESSVTA
jgi:hypothetical protein